MEFYESSHTFCSSLLSVIKHKYYTIVNLHPLYNHIFLQCTCILLTLIV